MIASVSFLGTVLGFIAGGILLVSGLPALREQLRGQEGGSTPGERKSRLIMALGNGLWVISGLLTMNVAVIAMCGMNTAIQLAIWSKSKGRRFDGN